MSIAVRQQGIHLVAEATPGTYEEPAAGDALEVENLKIQPFEQLRLVERNPYRAIFGPQVPAFGGSLYGMTFDVELKGSGSAGTPPRVGRILRAAGFAETIVAGTSVTYLPTSELNDQASLSGVVREGPNLRRVRGAKVASLSINCETGQRIMASVTLLARRQSEAVAAALAQTLEATTPPTFLNAAFTADGAQRAINALSIEMGLQVNTAPDPNDPDGFGQIRITDRAVTGSFDPEADSIATYDPIGGLRSEREFVIQSGVVGATVGNRVAISMPRCRYMAISDEEREMLKVWGIDFGAFSTGVGDDEIAIQFT